LYEEIRENLQDIDGLIVGSPVYYAGPNGSLCAILDRVFYSCSDLLKYKPAASVAVCRRGGASSTFDRYTPVDEQRTNEEHDIIFDESKAFSKQFTPVLNGDISVNYRINKRKLSHEFSLKMLNVGIRTGMHFYQYNEKTNKIKKEEGTGIIPNVSYKLYF
jgi:multimeric flavodoxin WrbA